MKNETIFAFIDNIFSQLCSISDAIFDYAEIGYQEFRSSALLRQGLERHGFAIEDLSAQVPNAFLARTGSGAPTVAILAEFDALPGSSQLAGVAEPQQNADETIKGFHGCGHHLFATACYGAALAAQHAMQAHHLPGTLVFCACPAEEGGAGKTRMVQAHAFDGVDCAITWHPDKMNAMRLFHTSALARYDFRFYGTGAHAANDPENGRSALDAVELMNVGVNYLREHIPSTARVHYAITNAGGPSPSVVQAQAEVTQCIRSVSVDGLLEVATRIQDIARGAALMTGTRVECRRGTGCVDIIPSKALAQVIYQNMERLPTPQPSSADKALALALAARCTAVQPPLTEETLYNTALQPFTGEEEREWGSGDTGDVSWNIPTAIFNATAFFRTTPGHSWQLAAQGKTDIAHACTAYAAKVLAASACDLLENPSIIRSAKEELAVRKQGKTHRPLLPGTFEPLA